jgi:hypothetical protein
MLDFGSTLKLKATSILTLCVDEALAINGKTVGFMDIIKDIYDLVTFCIPVKLRLELEDEWTTNGTEIWYRCVRANVYIWAHFNRLVDKNPFQFFHFH